jgi:hypothetical protein
MRKNSKEEKLNQSRNKSRSAVLLFLTEWDLLLSLKTITDLIKNQSAMQTIETTVSIYKSSTSNTKGKQSWLSELEQLR